MHIISQKRKRNFQYYNRIVPFLMLICKYVQQSTVNQLLFAATFFRDSSVINWLAASNFLRSSLLHS
jgi:hypothetical protein